MAEVIPGFQTKEVEKVVTETVDVQVFTLVLSHQEALVVFGSIGAAIPMSRDECLHRRGFGSQNKRANNRIGDELYDQLGSVLGALDINGTPMSFTDASSDVEPGFNYNDYGSSGVEPNYIPEPEENYEGDYSEGSYFTCRCSWCEESRATKSPTKKIDPELERLLAEEDARIQPCDVCGVRNCGY